MLYTSADGYVFLADSGNTFDGEIIKSIFELPYNHMGAPGVKKRMYNIRAEIISSGPGCAIYVQPIYKMYEPERKDVLATSVSGTVETAVWSRFNWSEASWAGDSIATAEDKVTLRGTTPGMGMRVTSNCFYGYTIKSFTVRFAPRGEVR
jgi:hypothetical protein